MIIFIWRPLERPLVSVSICSEPFALTISAIDAHFCRDGVAMDSEGVLKCVVVRIRREQ
jgi:hypothetical protein